MNYKINSLMNLCDICFKEDDKCNHCSHCDRIICQYCTKFMGPVKGFYCDWTRADGSICSECIEYKHGHYQENPDWKRDPYADEEMPDLITPDPANPIFID